GQEPLVVGLGGSRRQRWPRQSWALVVAGWRRWRRHSVTRRSLFTSGRGGLRAPPRRRFLLLPRHRRRARAGGARPHRRHGCRHKDYGREAAVATASAVDVVARAATPSELERVPDVGDEVGGEEDDREELRRDRAEPPVVAGEGPR
ncbi:Os09g0432700, partial [Oryza sativa Japonica Group]